GADAPVVIGIDQDPAHAQGLLINPHATLPADPERFSRIIEIVNQAPDLLTICREHFREYRQRGYAPQRVELCFKRRPWNASRHPAPLLRPVSRPSRRCLPTWWTPITSRCSPTWWSPPRHLPRPLPPSGAATMNCATPPNWCSRKCWRSTCHASRTRSASACASAWAA